MVGGRQDIKYLVITLPLEVRFRTPKNTYIASFLEFHKHEFRKCKLQTDKIPRQMPSIRTYSRKYRKLSFCLVIMCQQLGALDDPERMLIFDGTIGELLCVQLKKQRQKLQT